MNMNMMNVIVELVKAGILTAETKFMPLAGTLKNCVAVVNDGFVDAIAGEEGWSFLYGANDHEKTRVYPTLVYAMLENEDIYMDVLPDELVPLAYTELDETDFY